MTHFRQATQYNPEERMASTIQAGADTVLYDGDCRFCRANVRFLQKADRGRPRKLPVFWPFAIILHIPGTRRLWAWLYRKIAARRYWFGRITCDSNTSGLE